MAFEAAKVASIIFIGLVFFSRVTKVDHRDIIATLFTRGLVKKAGPNNIVVEVGKLGNSEDEFDNI